MEIFGGCSIYVIVIAFLAPVIFLLKRHTFKKHRRLENRHVLITGGSSGIGKCVAVEAIKLGANVTILARDEFKLKTACKELEAFMVKLGQSIRYISLDVGKNYENVKKSFSEAENMAGPVYMLVNSAGMSIGGKLEDMSMEETREIIDVNYFGTLHATKAVIGGMKERREGCIVVTASEAAFIGIFGLSIYCSAKYALRGLAEALHSELKPYNVGVTLALPPDTDTPGFEKEEKTKLLETKLICEIGGLHKPETVARQLMKDALARNFLSSVGFNGFILAAMASNTAPITSTCLLLMQILFSGFLRAVFAIYQFRFNRIVESGVKH